MDKYKDRIIKFEKMRIGDIADNPHNIWIHPKQQTAVVKGILEQYGKVAPVLSYFSEANQRQMFFDGHLRKDINPDETWWICYTDLKDDEALGVIGVYDLSKSLAEKEQEAFNYIAEQVKYENNLVNELIEKEKGENGAGGNTRGELEISPELFERHDYLVFYFDNEFDWQVACEKYGVKKVKDKLHGASTVEHIGDSRVLSGKVLL